MEDKVNHPKHYTQYKHEVIELTSCFDFVTGNAIKYLLRSTEKNGVEDLEKAVWYMNYGAEHPGDVVVAKPCGVVALTETYGNPIVTDLVRGIYQASGDLKEITAVLQCASERVNLLIKVSKKVCDASRRREWQEKKREEEMASLWKFTSTVYR